jgi:alkylation response protein AidB-like acyl-CoA dehydrogenase
MAALTEEQSMIRNQAVSWVKEQSPVQNFRDMRDKKLNNQFIPETWNAMVEMGWTGIIIPEEYGGSDLGYLTFGIIQEELGRHLAASPLFASALVGATAILLGGTGSQRQDLLPKIVDGSEILTLAVDESPRHKPEQIALAAKKTDDGFTLSGQKRFVHEGMLATTLIVAARTSGNAGDKNGITLFIVPADAAGISRESISMVDSRGYANISFEGVAVSAASVLGNIDEGFPILDVTLDRARAGLASEMLGTASQAFDMTLDYLKTRVQFGQVIGSFQALGHRAAGLFTSMELARSCIEGALISIDSDEGNVEEMCSLSKCKAGDFLHEMSNQLIQIHGGIGMTDEFDAGLYLKRARVLEATFGNQAFHRDRYARSLGF